MLSINTNQNSIKIQNQLSNVTDRLVNCTVRLSTGQKLNSAKDNAAGLYLSSGLKTRINALNIGINASQTGVSILNIAEGSISKMQQSLQRVRELAVEAASGYYTADARQAMQDEANALISQIYMEKDSCNFNGKELLNISTEPEPAPIPAGAFHQLTIDDFENVTTQAIDGHEYRTGERNGNTYYFIETVDQFEYAAHSDENYAYDKNFVFLSDLDMSGVSWRYRSNGTTIDGNGHVIKNFTSTVPLFKDNNGIIKNLGIENARGGSNILSLFVYENHGTIDGCYIKDSYIDGQDYGTYVFTSYNYGTISNSYITNTTIEGEVGTLFAYWGNGIIENCYEYNNNINMDYGYPSFSDGNNINCYASSPEYSSLYRDASWFASEEAATALGDVFEYIEGNDHPTLKCENPYFPPPTPSGGDKMRIQVGEDASASSYLELDLGFDLGTISVDLCSAASAANSIATIDTYLNLLNNKQSIIGASYNRLESVTQSNAVRVENLSASRSTIVDADIAKENSNYIKNQILQSAATTLFAQAKNINSQIILSLLNNL